MEIVSEAGAWLIDLLGMTRRDAQPALLAPVARDRPWPLIAPT